MFLDKDIIPYTTHSFKAYKSSNEIFIRNEEYHFLMELNAIDTSVSIDEAIEINQKYREETINRFNAFTEANQASCHHFIGEFRLDCIDELKNQKYEPIVCNFYGYKYFSVNDINIIASRIFRWHETKLDTGTRKYIWTIALLYSPLTFVEVGIDELYIAKKTLTISKESDRDLRVRIYI